MATTTTCGCRCSLCDHFSLCCPDHFSSKETCSFILFSKWMTIWVFLFSVLVVRSYNNSNSIVVLLLFFVQYFFFFWYPLEWFLHFTGSQIRSAIDNALSWFGGWTSLLIICELKMIFDHDVVGQVAWWKLGSASCADIIWSTSYNFPAVAAIVI